MIGHELAVEQRVTADLQSRDKMRQRNFRGIGRAAEHRFTKKRAAQRNAIKAADQLTIAPCLD